MITAVSERTDANALFFEREAERVAKLCHRVAERFACKAGVLDGSVRVERSDGSELVPQLMAAFGSEIRSITVGRPTLEDVFVHMTGHRLDEPSEAVEAAR